VQNQGKERERACAHFCDLENNFLYLVHDFYAVLSEEKNIQTPDVMCDIVSLV